MKKNNLYLASFLSIFMALTFIPMNIYLYPIDGGVNPLERIYLTIVLVIYSYLLLVFKGYLNKNLGYKDVNIAINILVLVTIIYIGATQIFEINNEVLSFVLEGIEIGLNVYVYGKLIEIEDDMFGVRNYLISFVILSSAVRITILLKIHEGMAKGFQDFYIFILLLCGILFDFTIGYLFYKVAKEKKLEIEASKN